jgi:hypothetical protein
MSMAMTRTTGRRVLLAAAGGLLLGVLIGVTLLALAPLWIHLEPVRKRIESAASSAVHGRITVGRIDLSFFPRPGVVIHELNLTVPGKVRGTVRSTSVTPILSTLLRGQFRPASVRLNGLDVTVELPESAKEEKPAPPPDPPKSLAPLITSIASEVSGLVFEVNGERIAFSRGGKTLLFVEGLRIEGAIDSGEGRSAVKLSRLSLESPRFLAEIALSADSALPRVELSARGSGLDVTALRGKLLPLAGDDPTVAEIFEIFRGGTLASFSFASGGRTAGDLGVFEGMSIRAVLAGGSVRIGSAGLDLEEASGEVAVEKAVLSAEHAAARIGRSRASEGSVRIGLGAGDGTLRVEAAVRSDLAELPAILSRAIRGGSFREELSLVTDLAGSAVGRIILENRAGGLRTTVSVSEMRLSGRHRKIPFPVSIEKGTFHYDGNRVGVGRLFGDVGRSTFSGLTARLRLGGSTLLEDVSGAFYASLDELYPWLASREGMEALRTEIPGLRGSVGLSVARLSGPVSRPGEWRYEATGSLKDLFLDASFLPKPLEVRAGEFRVDEETIRVSGLEARTMDADLKVSGTLDGYRQGLRKMEADADGEMGPESVRWVWEKASLPAELLPAAPITLREVRVGLDHERSLSLAGNFTVGSGPRVTLDLVGGKEGTDVRQLTIADGFSDASISLEFLKREFGLRFAGRLEAATLEKLLAERKPRHGRIEGDFRALVRRDRLGETSASGWLKVADIGVPTPAGEVTIESLDLRAAGSRLTAASSSVVLDGQRFSITGDAALRGEGLVLDMDAGTDALSWERIEAVLERMKRPESETPAAPVDATPSIPVRGEVRFSLGSFSFGKLQWRPVLGGVRIGDDGVGVTVREADLCGISTTGEMRFLRDGTTGVEARVTSAGDDINVPLACLGFEDVRMTGRYEASLEAGAKGEASELQKAVRGPLTLKAASGRIGNANMLTRLLDALNVTDVFAGKARNTLGEAVAYDELSIAGGLEGDRIAFREITLKTPGFTMAASGDLRYRDRSLDLLVLAHPISTLDRIIRKLPVLRYVLGRDFLAVAAKVTGTVDDPKVHISPARDVGQGLVDVLSRTVRLPVHVFDARPP